MARIGANGAVVSDDGRWYHNGVTWSPLVEGASGKPKLSEGAAAAKMANVTSAYKGRKLAQLVAEHGSLEAAERAIGDAEAGGLKQKIVTYKDRAEFEAEAPRMMAAGWRIQGQDKDQDRTTVGRVGGGAALGTVILPGLGTLVGAAMGGASKRRGKLQVVWERD
ncbi:hypothetical protein [Nocardiopsis alba]|uniref:hypothetical protein n=1 Tax=Nocardiopsis alba TaxID=53437 RepID=UPI003D7042EA